MPFLVNGTDIREVVANGVNIREVYANGVLVWASFDGQFNYDTSATVVSSTSYQNQWRQDTPTHFYASTNNVAPLGFISGNTQNPTDDGLNWFQADNGVYGIWTSLTQWRSGSSSSDRTLMQLVLYATQSQPIVDSTDIVFFVNGVRTVSTTVGAMKALGFTEEFSSSAVTYYPGLASVAPNSPFPMNQYTLKYEGPIGAPGDATVEGWLDLLMDKSGTGFNNVDRTIEIGTLGGGSNTHSIVVGKDATSDLFGYSKDNYGTLTPVTVPTPIGEREIARFRSAQFLSETLVSINDPALEGVNLAVWIDGERFEFNPGQNTGSQTIFQAFNFKLATYFYFKEGNTVDMRIEFYGQPS